MGLMLLRMENNMGVLPVIRNGLRMALQVGSLVKMSKNCLMSIMSTTLSLNVVIKWM